MGANASATLPLERAYGIQMHWGCHTVEGGGLGGACTPPFVCINNNAVHHVTGAGLFKAQEADGIMGLNRASTPRHAPCVQRSTAPDPLVLHPPGQSFISSLFHSNHVPEHKFAMCMNLRGGVMTLGGSNHGVERTPMQYTPMSGGG